LIDSEPFMTGKGAHNPKIRPVVLDGAEAMDRIFPEGESPS
jgi:hypothetical protein